MIGIDTNVLVRLLAQDDVQQSTAAAELFARLTADDPGFVSLPVLVETHWVLKRAYRMAHADLVNLFTGLLEAAELRFQAQDIVHAALARASTGADLPDALIAELAEAHGCTDVVTFDKDAARLLRMRLL